MQIISTRTRRAIAVLAAATAASGAFAAQAGAHARVYPGTVLKGTGNAYSLVVPNESKATISEVKLTVPKGFLIGGFEASPGWKRKAQSEGDGHSAVTRTVTWSGGKTPAGEAAWFRFTGRPDEEAGADLKEYRFEVEQTYSDGKVANWAGPEDSEEPAPVVELTGSLGGSSSAGSEEPPEAAAVPAGEAADEADDDDEGGSTATIALIVAVLALLAALGALMRRGSRSLT